MLLASTFWGADSGTVALRDQVFTDSHVAVNDADYGNVNGFLCNLCPFVSSHRSSLNRHIRETHKGKKPFFCTACSVSFKRAERLRDHICPSRSLR